MQEADVKYTYPQTSNTLTRRHAGGPEAALDEWVCAGPCRNLKDKCRNVALGLHVCSRIMFLPVRAPHAPAGTQAHAPGREFVQTHRTGAALPLLLQTADVVLHPSSMRHVIALWLVVLLLNLEKLLQPPWTPCAGGAEDSQGRISGGERIGVLNRTFPSPGHATAISGASDECAHCGAVASSPSGAFGRAAVSDAILMAFAAPLSGVTSRPSAPRAPPSRSQARRSASHCSRSARTSGGSSTRDSRRSTSVMPASQPSRIVRKSSYHALPQ